MARRVDARSAGRDACGGGATYVSSRPSRGEAITARIFISYRREDSSAYAGRLYDDLVERFGKDQVFMDLLIPPGEDFVERIEEGVGSCDVLLALIGPRWLSVTGAEARRRLDDPGDFTRIEVEAGLARNVRVMPVLVGGAKMPASPELPEPLSPLSRRQALEISDTRWRYDVDRLIEALEQVTGETASPAPSEPVPVESGPSGPLPATGGGGSPAGAPAAAGGGVAPSPPGATHEGTGAPSGPGTHGAAGGSPGGPSQPTTGTRSRKGLIIAGAAAAAVLLLLVVVAIALLAGGSGEEKVTATLKRFQSMMRTGDPEACRLLTASERKAAAAQADASDCADGIAKLDDGVGHVLRDFSSAPVRNVRVSGDSATAEFVLPAKRLDRREDTPLATELRHSGSEWLVSKVPGLRPPGAPIDEEGLREHIPGPIRRECVTEPKNEWFPNVIESVVCPVGDGMTVWYSLFGAQSQMAKVYRDRLKVRPDTGQCPGDLRPESEQSWSYQQSSGRDAGRLNCYKSSKAAGATWTTDQLLILGIVTGSKKSVDEVHKKWLEAGPIP